MGQNFQLVAPRAKIYLPWAGKLGELLFDGSAEELVRLLAVPVRPHSPAPLSKVVTSTPVQPRNDCFAAESAAGGPFQEIRASEHLKRKADGEAHDDCPRHLKLAKPKSGDPDDEADTNHFVAIFDLPVEVHRHIFTHIEFIEDVIALGLTSRHFWAIAREHVYDYYTSFLGLWAGENIVCVGEDVIPGDFPPGLFSAEERDELCKKTVDIPYDDNYPDDVAYPAVPFTLHHFTLPSVSDRQEDTDLMTESLGIYLHCKDRSRSKDPAFRSTRSEIVVTDSTYFPQDQPWILRNLTTKEFVRSEAIALEQEFIHGPNIDVLGFGEAIMARICWSTSSFVSMNDVSNISRGVWAGHSFDITTLARHRDESRGEKWRDVSEEVADEIADIWEGEYGPDWRETVCNLWYQKYGRVSKRHP
ncbi:F-box domain containing protein [Pleurostoma richardsiae]|uniref:F-box domain containing protein n=1 Tax=Pleurostoma richardsiae TaxID=41990 RepID=A0AA38R3R0_9PEZI|nr:F-box domain containing protein [Pleurostoma richardsiae]